MLNLLSEKAAVRLWMNRIYIKLETCSKGYKVPFDVTGHIRGYKLKFTKLLYKKYIRAQYHGER